MQATLVHPGGSVAADQVHPRIGVYMRTGAPVSTYMRDLGGGLNQIPRWGWGVICAVSAYAAYRGYGRWKGTGTTR